MRRRARKTELDVSQQVVRHSVLSLLCRLKGVAELRRIISDITTSPDTGTSFYERQRKRERRATLVAAGK